MSDATNTANTPCTCSAAPAQPAQVPTSQPQAQPAAAPAQAPKPAKRNPRKRAV